MICSGVSAKKVENDHDPTTVAIFLNPLFQHWSIIAVTLQFARNVPDFACLPIFPTVWAYWHHQIDRVNMWHHQLLRMQEQMDELIEGVSYLKLEKLSKLLWWRDPQFTSGIGFFHTQPSYPIANVRLLYDCKLRVTQLTKILWLPNANSYTRRPESQLIL